MITNQHSIIFLDKHKKNTYNYTLYINKVLKNLIQLYIKSSDKADLIKKNILFSLKFIKLLIIYLIEKYYYNLNFVYFIKKASMDNNTFDFFITLNKLKNKLTFTKKEDKPYTRLMYFYIIMLIAYLFIAPGSWFLLRVCTDPQNWFSYNFSQINLTNLL